MMENAEGELKYNAASEHENGVMKWLKGRKERKEDEKSEGEDREERGGWGVYHAGAVGG